MRMTKETMRASIASALAKVQETGRMAEATLPEDNDEELENELVMLGVRDGRIAMWSGWDEHEMDLVYEGGDPTFDVEAAMEAAWPDMA